MSPSKIKSSTNSSPKGAQLARNGGSAGSPRTPRPAMKNPTVSPGSNKRKLSSTTDDDSGAEDEDDLDGDNSEDEENDDEEKPAAFAPPRGKDRESVRKAGLKVASKKGKKLKLARDEYDSGSDDVSSVSSCPPDDSASADSDSDDGYEGVDEVNDADDEDVDVEREEEKMIMRSEYAKSPNLLPSLPGADRFDDWLGLDDLDNRPLYSAGSFLDEGEILMHTATADFFEENDVSSVMDDTFDTPTVRHVHFEDSDSSSDSSDKTTDDELLPDFLQQDSLDPDLRRMIESDSDPFARRGSPQSVHSAFNEVGNIYHVESDSSTVTSSSGYESDGGETTDEDYPPPATITHPRSILRRDSSASLPTFPDEARRSRPSTRRGPLRGIFVADPHKPVAVVAPNGKQLIVIPPYASARHDWLESATNSLANTANNSPRTATVNNVDDSDTDAVTSPVQTDMSPMLSSSANLMLAALGSNSAGQVMGPPEAFYPNPSLGTSLSFADEDDEDSEAALNVDDFIDFGNGSSDEDMNKGFDDDDDLNSPVVAPSVTESITPTPNRNVDMAESSSNAERFLNHLDRGVVTAFRRNHSRYQALIRLPQHREFVPANSPSRPASVFRRTKFTAPKTPPRKRQASTYASGEAVRRKLMDSHRSSKPTF